MIYKINELKEKEPELYASYEEIINSVSHNLEIDENGILRWEADALTKKLYEIGSLDLNKIYESRMTNKLSHDDFLKFERNIGSSLSSYWDTLDSVNGDLA